MLVTGGAGFLGSHLVDALVAAHVNVVIVDNFFRGSKNNLADHLNSGSVELCEADIRNRRELEEYFHGVDTVFHFAAINGTLYFYQMPLEVLDVNIDGTRNVLSLAAEHGIKKVVFASTSEIYGHPSTFPTGEDQACVLQPALSPRWSYAASKLCDEQLCYAYYQKHSLDVTILRYFNVYGPRMVGTAYGQVVGILIKRVLEGRSPIIYGDGTQTRSFTYVSDATEAALLAVQAPEAAGQVFNVGRNEETRIDELARMILVLCKRQDLRLEYAPPRLDEPRRRCPDIAKAMKVLGWMPKVGLEEGLRKTIQWYRQAA